MIELGENRIKKLYFLLRFLNKWNRLLSAVVGAHLVIEFNGKSDKAWTRYTSKDVAR